MGQNKSSAVMQQRAEPGDSLDDFPTPPWATRALCAELVAMGEPLHLQHVWEPACNRGHMARPLGEYFDHVHATDVHDYGWPGQAGVADFLIDWAADAPDVDWVITNPPFRLAADFIHQGLRYARRGVAVFVRTAFVEGEERYRTLFRDRPECVLMPFVERVAIWRGVLLDPDVKIWDDKRNVMKNPSSATSYCWMLFYRDRRNDTSLRRIAPCRRALTRPGDYPPVPVHMRPPRGALIGTFVPGGTVT